jgi:hypothetical protein
MLLRRSPAEATGRLGTVAEPKPEKRKLRIVAEYAGAVVLCLLILTCVMKLWQADFKIPFTYFGDALLNSVAAKGAIEQGWWLHNSSLGAPGGLDYAAYPTIDNAHFLLIKIISLLTGDYALTLNLFYLLTFPLTTLTSLCFFKYFKFSYGVGLLGSLLFTFLPYHFFRSYHLFLAAYYPLPLMILVILWICAGGAFIVEPSLNRRLPKLRLRNSKTFFALAVCAFVGSCGIYYPFFSCFFLVVAGVLASLQRRALYPMLAASILIAFMSAVVVINYLPLINYQHSHVSASLGTRSVADAEVMGLKITQLLLPIGGHRVTALGALKYRYNLGPLVNENDTASLGLIGSIGFLTLIFRLFHKKPNAPMLDRLSVLNGAGLLLGTIGGFGTLFALLVSAQIRAYNRISVFVAFFSLVSVALILDPLYKSLKSRKAQLGCLLVLSVLVVVGVLDQTSTTFFFVPEYEAIKTEYRSDSDFVKNIEASLPTRAMIFQLPYVPFPESPPLNKMTQDHEHFKGYLHSKALRWSYGVINGEKEDLWQRSVVAKPAAEFVQEISSAGFLGIYINRNGYPDGGARLEADLTALLGVKPTSSRTGNLIFFSLTGYPNGLKARN